MPKITPPRPDGLCSTCCKLGFNMGNEMVSHPECKMMCRGHILIPRIYWASPEKMARISWEKYEKKEEMKNEYARLIHLVELWCAGVVALLVVYLFGILGFTALFYIVSGGYVLALLLLGVITIPILIAMFILPRFGVEI